MVNLNANFNGLFCNERPLILKYNWKSFIFEALNRNCYNFQFIEQLILTF